MSNNWQGGAGLPPHLLDADTQYFYLSHQPHRNLPSALPPLVQSRMAPRPKNPPKNQAGALGATRCAENMLARKLTPSLMFSIPAEHCGAACTARAPGLLPPQSRLIIQHACYR
jgi:hypothetical protein